MSQEIIFTKARIVTPDAVIDGSVRVVDDRIAEFDTKPSAVGGAVDLEGDLLIPGLIELHTDNLERHFVPRPKTHWPSLNAVIAHDGEIAAAGITTVFDAIAVGAFRSRSYRMGLLGEMVDAVDAAGREDLVRADHFMHLRCEVADGRMLALLEELIDRPLVKLVSLMDHTPGQRQFTDLDKFATYHKGRYGLNDDELAAYMEERRADQEAYGAPQRRAVVEMAHQRGLALASHDDATEAHVSEAEADGVSISEFPTQMEAARACRDHGLNILMGAPNLVRGGSHSGNVSARETAEAGLLDILSSDYVPSSLLHGALMLDEEVEGYDLPRAIATVTRNPARAVGLNDRGEIAPGLRADLVRLRRTGSVARVRGVWKAGERVA